MTKRENNVTQERTYITHDWCELIAKEYKVKDTTHRDLRDEPEEYVYEDVEGNITKIVQLDGVRVEEDKFVWTFTKVDETTFEVVVEQFKQFKQFKQFN